MTADDYEAIVRNIYPATSDIIIFGGEDQVPPEYGKVFISLKPKIRLPNFFDETRDC